MGLALEEMRSGEVSMVRGMEVAVTFYLLGKVSRAISAIAKGELPSADTRKDIRVYGTMLEHVAVFGTWGRFDEKPQEDDFFDVNGRGLHAGTGESE
jgi:hypothetical protein